MDADLGRCRDLLHDAVRGLSAAEAAVRPGDRWSIAEIVEHLALTYTGTAKGFERLLGGAVPLPPAPTPRQRFWTFVITGLGVFPRGRAAPKPVVPSGIGLDAALARAAAGLEAFDAGAARAEARFGHGYVLTHPILGPFTVRHWRRFHVVHTRHHVRQIAARRRG
jgi:hypothetical protein